MTLSEFATFSTAISGLAVTASLIYLALQTHQNAKHTRALIQQGRLSHTLALTSFDSGSDMVVAYLEANGVTPTPEEIRRYQYSRQADLIIHIMRDTFLQHGAGLLHEGQFNSALPAYRGWLARSGNRAHWNRWRAPRVEGDRAFISFVDGLVPGNEFPDGHGLHEST